MSALAATNFHKMTNIAEKDMSELRDILLGGNIMARNRYFLAMFNRTAKKMIKQNKRAGVDDVMPEFARLLVAELEPADFALIAELYKAIEKWDIPENMPGKVQDKDVPDKPDVPVKIVNSPHLSDKIKIMELQKYCDNFKSHTEQKINQHIEEDNTFPLSWLITINPESILDKKLKNDIQAYNAVEKMSSVLSDDVPSDMQKINNFSGIFYKNKHLLEVTKDSTATRFIKDVVRIISHGISSFFGVFKSERRENNEPGNIPAIAAQGISGNTRQVSV